MGKQSRILSAASNGEIQQFLQLIGEDESLIDAIDENGDTVLHLACCNSKALVVAKQIVNKYPHLVNKTNNDGSKPIHITALSGNADVFWFFIDKFKSLIDAVDNSGDTVLHQASFDPDAADLAKQIIDKYPHFVDKTNNDGKKPIHIAAQYGNADVFWYFIDKDKSLIDAVDNIGDTVLHYTCVQFEDFDLAKNIITTYPHLLHMTNKYGFKTIHCAINYGNTNIFWYLIDKDKRLIDAVDNEGNTVLHIACNQFDAVDNFAIQIAIKYPHLMHMTNYTGKKPIHYAVYYGNADVFWYFIDKYENLIYSVDKDDETVLHKACIKSDAVDLAKQIADKYSHLLHKTNNNGRLPIHYAADFGNAGTFWYFIHKDESLIDAVYDNGKTVLHIASNHAVDLAKEIANKYPHLIQKTDNDGCKPIHCAAEKGNTNVFWYFVDKDEILIDAVDKDGFTVLHHASAQSDAVDLAKEIADKHPHLIQKRHNNGCKPIHVAAYHGNADVFWYFIDKNKNLIDTVDKDGKTVLDYASGNFAKEIADKYPHLVDKTKLKLKRNSI